MFLLRFCFDIASIESLDDFYQIILDMFIVVLNLERTLYISYIFWVKRIYVFPECVFPALSNL